MKALTCRKKDGLYPDKPREEAMPLYPLCHYASFYRIITSLYILEKVSKISASETGSIEQAGLGRLDCCRR